MAGDELLFGLGLMSISRAPLPTTFTLRAALHCGSSWREAKTQQRSLAALCSSPGIAHFEISGGASYAEVFH
jgi:hypothetical protein